jgi:hypothetical protein
MKSWFDTDPCARCEELLQPFLDRELTVDEQALAEQHLERCLHCRKRYTFEVSLRRYVRLVADEPMSPELKQKLLSLRTPL